MKEFPQEFDKKNFRRENIKNKSKQKNEVSENEKAVNKLNKAFKQKKNHLREEELWDDWEEYQ